MSLYNFFRGVFGFPPDGNFNRRNDNSQDGRNEFRNPIWNLDDDDDDDDDFRAPPRSRFGFHVDSDPFEMHRFFEQQMEDIMRSFQSFGFGFGSGIFGPGGRGIFSLEPPSEEDLPALPGIPGLPALPEGPGHSGSLRDNCLKPGYEGGSSGQGPARPRCDRDLDEQVQAGDLSSLLRRGPTQPSHEAGSGSFFSRTFGRSVTSRTVRLPHGGVESTQTSRDSQGNEETTVTRSLGKQSYSVLTRRDANGQVQTEENFVNMREEDLPQFEQRWGSKL